MAISMAIRIGLGDSECIIPFPFFFIIAAMSATIARRVSLLLFLSLSRSGLMQPYVTGKNSPRFSRDTATPACRCSPLQQFYSAPCAEESAKGDNFRLRACYFN